MEFEKLARKVLTIDAKLQKHALALKNDNLDVSELKHMGQTIREDARRVSSLLSELRLCIKESDALLQSSLEDRMHVLESTLKLSKELLKRIIIRERQIAETDYTATKSSLFSDAPSRIHQQTQKDESHDENFSLKKSKELTLMLKRTNALIHKEIERTTEANTVFSIGTESIRNTVKGMDQLSSSVRDGSKAVNRLSRREKTDKLLLRIAMLFFMATVFFIVYKRLGSRIVALFWKSSGHDEL